MEKVDLKLIEEHLEEDGELKGLWEQHQEFEKMLEKYESKPYLSPVQTQEMKELKKKKLAGKTRLQSLLDKYRNPEE